MNIVTSSILVLMRKPLSMLGFDIIPKGHLEAAVWAAKADAIEELKNSINGSIANYFDAFDIAYQHMDFESDIEKDFVSYLGRDSIFYLVNARELSTFQLMDMEKYLPYLREKYIGFKSLKTNVPITSETFDSIQGGSIKDLISLLLAVVDKNWNIHQLETA